MLTDWINPKQLNGDKPRNRRWIDFNREKEIERDRKKIMTRSYKKTNSDSRGTERDSKKYLMSAAEFFIVDFPLSSDSSVDFVLGSVRAWLGFASSFFQIF